MDLILSMYFLTASKTYKLPEGLLNSVCFMESAYDVNAVHHDDGDSDSLGICQVKLETARWLGFTGSRNQLMQPETNINYAAKYLHFQLRRYKSIPKALTAYNKGSALETHSEYSDKIVDLLSGYETICNVNNKNKTKLFCKTMRLTKVAQVLLVFKTI